MTIERPRRPQILTDTPSLLRQKARSKPVPPLSLDSRRPVVGGFHRGWLGALIAFSLVTALGNAQAATSVVFTSVPAYGSIDNLQGRVYGVDSTNYRVVVFINKGQQDDVSLSSWSSEPGCTSGQTLLTTIQSNGTWTADVTNVSGDENATQIAAYVVPATSSPPCVTSSACLPDSILAQSVANTIATRSAPNLRSFHWSGLDWWVKSIFWGPGPNYFTNSTNNVFVDAQGRLHLRITFVNGTWYCSEIVSFRTLGLGSYFFYLDTPVDALDPNITLGLFTWSNAADYTHREIDVEGGRWGDPGDFNNAQFVIQPYYLSNHLVRYRVPPSATNSMHSFNWQSSSIAFTAVTGTTTVASWTYTSGFGTVPPSCDENVRFNLWLNNTSGPMNGQEVEVIVNKFVFVGPDTDSDGMPDAWELAHGLDPNDSTDADRDDDGDGFTNLQEYLDGTDPADPGSHASSPDNLSVSPGAGLASQGLEGGPFMPSNATYTLTNSGPDLLSWQATNATAWVTLSTAAGTLAAHTSTNVTVSINATANGLPLGSYNDTVAFSNLTTATGSATRSVSLIVGTPTPPTLSVSPTDGFSPTGSKGGPFLPSSKAYALINTGSSSMDWSASKSLVWLTLSASSGTLPAATTNIITVSVNANANSLPPGTYTGSVLFSNTTNGAGGTTRVATLTVNKFSVNATFVGAGSGNGNGLIDANECNEVFVVLRNDTFNTLSTVNATLSTSTPEISIVQPASAYPDIPAGGMATNLVPFRVSTSPAFTCGGASNLELTVTSTGGSQTTIFSFLSGSNNYATAQSNGVAIVPGITDIGNHCDDCTTAIGLPFPYTFYGQIFSNAAVSSNGNLQFLTSATSFNNLCLPYSGLNYAILPLWDDLYTGDTASGQGIFTSISGSAPNRIFNIEWRAQACCLSGAPTLDFEIRLYEGQQRVDLVYGVLNGNGSSATVGIQNGNIANQFECNSGGLSSGLMLTYQIFACTDGGGQCPPVASYTGTPMTGTEPLTVTFTDTSTGSITNRFWDFGDGGTANVTTNTVAYTYYAGGTYTVTLIVSGSDGASTNTQPNYISVLTTFQAWQVQYFGSTNGSAAATADADGDGQNNLAEFQAGTDPTNSASAFRITSVVRTNDDIQITWSGGSEGLYYVQTNSAAGGSYTNDFTNLSHLIHPSGNTGSYTHGGGATNIPTRYYRVLLYQGPL